jgi:hypothetical protein
MVLERRKTSRKELFLIFILQKYYESLFARSHLTRNLHLLIFTLVASQILCKSELLGFEIKTAIFTSISE